MLTIEELPAKRIRLIFTNERNAFGKYRIRFNREETQSLVTYLENLYGQRIEAQPAAYSEEISTYKNHIERTLNVTTDSKRELLVTLTCYTDGTDDNWVELTERRATYLISLLKGYLVHAFNG